MYLLDTNVYGEVTEARLSGDAMNKMLDSEELYLSIVSLWERGCYELKIMDTNIRYLLKIRWRT